MYEFGQEEIDSVVRVMARRRLFRYLDRESSEASVFEGALARMLGVEHAIGVNSGTSALITGLVALGIGPSDEVIVPGYTFVATPIAVMGAGAVPIIANVDATLTIDPSDVERRVTSRTRAIIPVHMRGFPCNMERVMDIAKRHDLLVLEDVAQAAGGTYRGARLGSIGHAGAFSFNHFKIIACGEGGAVTTSIRKVYERALIHHDSACAAFGRNADRLSEAPFAGQNYRMSEIAAAILVVQVRRLDGILQRLRNLKREAMSQCESMGVATVASNDDDGDCGTTIGLRYGSSEEADRATRHLQAGGFDAVVPLSTGKHVFQNWTPILDSNEQVKAALARNESLASLRPTLNHLAASVLVLPTLEWSAAEPRRLAVLCSARVR